jgi:uncharacterized protein
MAISMYQACIPPFIRSLKTLDSILGKAAAHAQTRKIDEAALLNSRLFPDMFPLVRQVQIVSDTAKSGAGRLAGTEFPTYEDKEATFQELQQRIRATVTYLQTLTPAQIDGSEGKTISWQTRSSTRTMEGLPYLMEHLLPNVHFHVTTAYAILRHNGIEIGKKDFLGI